MSTATQTRVKPMAALAASFTPAPSGLLQRKCACGGSPGSEGECDECRKKKLVGSSGSLQRAPASLTAREPSEVPPIVHQVLRSPGQRLDAATRDFFEPRFGHDFSQVRVHTDAEAAESARAVNALAYTVGQDIVSGAGQYAPGTATGRRLLAHELSHVVQQKHLYGAPVSISEPDSALEREADHAAERAVAGAACPALLSARAPTVAREIDTRRMPAQDGGEVKVERIVTPGRCALAPESRASTSGDITASNAFLQIDMCRGSVAGQVRGEIDYGDALQQAGKAVGSLLSNVASGQPSAQALSTFSNDLKQLRPGAQVRMNLLASDLFRLDIIGTGGASAAAGASGQATARAQFDVGPVQLGVQGTVSGGTQEQTRYQIIGTVTFGGTKQRAPNCRVCECAQPKIEFRCTQIPGRTPAKPPPAPPEPRFIPYFFDYADITPNPRLAKMNQQNLLEAVNLIASDYTVARIEGSASPEGPLQGRRGRFTNNTRLAEARAVEGQKQLQQAIQNALKFSLLMRTENLRRALDARYPVVGRGELFGSGARGEVPDPALFSFLQTTLALPPAGQPDPLALEHVTGTGLSGAVQAETEADVKAFRKEELAKKERLEAIYQPLRRALIVLNPPPQPPLNLRLTPGEVENIVGKGIPCTQAHRALFAGVAIGKSFEGECNAPGLRPD